MEEGSRNPLTVYGRHYRQCLARPRSGVAVLLSADQDQTISKSTEKKIRMQELKKQAANSKTLKRIPKFSIDVQHTCT